jgi:hypothetical protein
MYHCRYCNRQFRTKETISSHIRLFHRKEEDIECGEEARSEVSSISHEPPEDQSPTTEDSQSGHDSETDKETTSSTSNDSSRSSESESMNESTDSEEESDHDELVFEAWKDNMEDVIASTDLETNSGNLLLEPQITQLHQHLCDHVLRSMKKAEAFRQSDLINGIHKAAADYERKYDCKDHWESFHSAWDTQKYRVLKFLQTHQDHIIPAAEED